MMDLAHSLSATGRRLNESVIRRMGSVIPTQGNLVSFAHGFPDSRLFPWSELGEITAGLLSGVDSTTLQYGEMRGYKPLIESILTILAARGITASYEEVIITCGAQQGVDLAARLLVDPGDVVLMELPTYPGAIASFVSLQATIAGVEQDDDGISLEDLETVWRRQQANGRPVKLLYLVPNFQNPSGRLLSLEKRKYLVDWAERHSTVIIEDDPYGSLYFEGSATGEETRPICADGRECVIYLGSFSKMLAPGLRIGWMLAPAPIVRRLEAAKMAADLNSGMLSQRIVDAAIRRGVIGRLAPTLRDVYRRKRDAMEQTLRHELGHLLRWSTPKGGFFLWVTLPSGCTDRSLLGRAIEQRVIFVTGSAFYVDGGGHNKIRLSFSAPSHSQIRRGITRLAAALAAELRHSV
jgi:2-aminoadipate transaminase